MEEMKSMKADIKTGKKAQKHKSTKATWQGYEKARAVLGKLHNKQIIMDITIPDRFSRVFV